MPAVTREIAMTMTEITIATMMTDTAAALNGPAGNKAAALAI
jgi:nicotinamide mononucleotide (NMN) deamidase PncC